MGLIRYSRWDRSITKRKQGVCIANLVGPFAHFGETKTLRREIGSLQSHLGETEIPIGETELIRVSGSGYVNRTWWLPMERFGGVELDFLV